MLRKSLPALLAALLLVAFWVAARGLELQTITQTISILKKDVRDFQSLIAGLIALFAAWIAARPVYDQLQSLRIQNDIMSRDILSNRISLLENRRNQIRNDISTFFQTYRNPYILDDFSTIDLNSHAAFDAEQSVDAIVRCLRDLHSKEEDGAIVQTARQNLIVSGELLATCLDRIHSPDSRSGDPELPAGAEVQMAEEASLAKQELPQFLIQFDAKAEALVAAYEQELTAVRGKIRKIDSSLYKQH